MRVPNAIPAQRLAVGTVALGGLINAVGQTLIVRELLVLFYGNELSAGLTLTAWLLWIGAGSGLAGIFHRRLPGVRALAIVLLAQALLLPLSVLWIRASRMVWNVPSGELLPPGKMLAISVTATGLFCLASGALFALGWKTYTESSPRGGARPIFIYLGEAAGAMAGGLLFYFVLISRVSVLAAACVTSFLVVLALALLPAMRGPLPEQSPGGSPPGRETLLRPAIFLAPLAVLLLLSNLENHSRRWQWGPDLVSVRDTPYNNLALLQDQNQYTLFANGLWLFSVPDPQSAELAVHPALLQHPNPKSVLLIGGGAEGLVQEVLRHHSDMFVDVLEPDPGLLAFIDAHLPASFTASLRKRRVRVLHEDAVSYIRRTRRSYDVILMNVGDPMNAQMNRYYTVEFQRRAAGRLNPGGFFSFAVSSAPDVLGPAQARFLRSVYATLLRAFPQAMVHPGEMARFFAAGKEGSLTDDPGVLTERLAARDLDLQYVREYYFLDMLSPMRLEYFRTLLAGGEDSREKVNHDFAPTCYFYNVVLWGEQMHTGLKRAFTSLARIDPLWFWSALAGILGSLLLVFASKPAKPRGAVAVCVAVVGALQITVEMTLLLAFQTLAGFVYTQLALIMAFFMGGLAAGAAASVRLSRHLAKPRRLRRAFVLTQAVLGLYPLGLMAGLFLIRSALQHGGPLSSLPWIFSLLSLAAGVLGGLHYSLAVSIFSRSATPSAQTGGGLYALDLAGSAVGALTASLFIFPVFGMVNTLTAFSLLALGCLPVLGLGFRR